MEEILASIRRIISEDGDEIVYGNDRLVSKDEDNVTEDKLEPVFASADNDDDDDILELTDVIDDQPTEELDSGTTIEEELEIENGFKIEKNIEIAEKSESESEIGLVAADDDDKLVSDEVEDVSVATMSGLAAVLSASAEVGDGDKTLETLTKELLRPVLKQWLNENLPDMVERIVREEVERIAERARK